MLDEREGTFELPEGQSDLHPDWIRLWHSPRFYEYTHVGLRGRLERWRVLECTREAVKKSAAYQAGLPVFSPGRSSDIVYPLLLTDAQEFIFVAPPYTNHPLSPSDYLAQTIRTVLDTEITADHQEATNKRVLEFDWANRRRQVTIYEDDPLQFMPEETSFDNLFTIIQHHPMSVRGEPEIWNMSLLSGPERCIRFYRHLAIEGFINWDPMNFILDPTLIGFHQVLTPRGQPLNYPIYQKVAHEAQLPELVRVDALIRQSTLLRDGCGPGRIDHKTLGEFSRYLGILRVLYNQLTPEKQDEVLLFFKKQFTMEGITPTYLEGLRLLGQKAGIFSPEDALVYLHRTSEIFLDRFPEAREIPSDGPFPLQKDNLTQLC